MHDVRVQITSLIMTNRLKNFPKALLQKPRVTNYCKYKFHSSNIFSDQFLRKPNHDNVSIQNKNLKGFWKSCLTVLSSIALLKRSFTRANQKPFIVFYEQRTLTGYHEQIKSRK